MSVPEIFDRNARRLRFARRNGTGFFAETMVADLFDRLDVVRREFASALVVGHHALLADGLKARGIGFEIYSGDEDHLHGRDGQHDLILSSGNLDTVSDLPGTLLLMRRALKPDGLLLANFAGAPSLPTLRQAISTVDAEADRAIARMHPQIDVRSAGDLLVRAGFALPVADLDTVKVAYTSLARLVTDLREAAASNLLVERFPVRLNWLTKLDNAFSALAGADGRTLETLSYITLTAWSPAPNQPQPAQRGSGTASLAAALSKRRD